MNHPALSAGRVAVVTGAASGIGLAACKKFASMGLKLCMSDVTATELAQAAEGLKDQTEVLSVVCDVSKMADVEALRDAAYATYGEVSVLMNNAAARNKGGCWDSYADWQQTINVNMWGVINGVQAFAPRMIAQGAPSAIVNTGSKQGITNPPNNPPYNVSKAAVKSYTELLQHELRNTPDCRVTAHLLVPGWTTTGTAEHKPGAWLPEQVIDMMLTAIEQNEFYIICPDDEVTPEMDRQRFFWATQDITENRPPLSRWHEDYKEAFKAYSKSFKD